MANDNYDPKKEGRSLCKQISPMVWLNKLGWAVNVIKASSAGPVAIKIVQLLLVELKYVWNGFVMTTLY